MAAAIGIAKTATEIFLGVGEISIDNLTFKLFYKWSVTLLIVCSVLVQTSQFFGEPVQCETADDSVDDDVLNAFCWMYSSFDIPPDFTAPCSRRRLDGNYLYNTYYQWVSIFLGAQAVIFYIPRCIWLMFEGGLMAYIVKGTTGRVVEYADEKLSRMLKHFQEHVHNKFNRYTVSFFLCEIMNLFAAVCSIYATHIFLNEQFIQYGYQVFSYFQLPPEERRRPDVVNPMCEVFPKMAACNYKRYGMGGRIDSRSAICVLGLNMINDKVFILLWLWYCMLIVMGCVRVITRSTQLLSPHIRFFLMKIRVYRFFIRNAHANHIRHYIMNCSVGDWFVLYQMSKNLNKRFFAEFLTVLSLTVNPDPSIEPEEPEIYLTQEEIERHKNWTPDSGGSCDEGEEEVERRRSGNPLAKCEDELDTSPEGPGSHGGGLSSKQRVRMKLGKGALAAKHKAMLATSAMRKMKRK